MNKRIITLVFVAAALLVASGCHVTVTADEEWEASYSYTAECVDGTQVINMEVKNPNLSWNQGEDVLRVTSASVRLGTQHIPVMVGSPTHIQGSSDHSFPVISRKSGDDRPMVIEISYDWQKGRSRLYWHAQTDRFTIDYNPCAPALR